MTQFIIMQVFGVFINILLLVKLLLAERNQAHGLMLVTGNSATMSKKGIHSFNPQRGNKGNWYKYKRFQKIFGGEEVTSIEEFPYMAYIMYIDVQHKNRSQWMQFVCGATILHEHYLLTAAHCVADCTLHEARNKDEKLIIVNNCTELDKNMYEIYVGSTIPDRALTKAKVKAFHIHPEYQAYDGLNHCIYNHDLAIVELRRPLQFNSKMSRVPLPLHSSTLVPTVSIKNCTIIGWGLTSLDEPRQNLLKRLLKAAKTNVIDNQECSHRVKIRNPDVNVCQSTQICTMDPENIIGTCHGDSGGPLICDGVQIGTVSGGSGGSVCVGPDIVTLYSRVDVEMKWIRSIISK